GTSDPQCVVWDYGNPEAGAENWGTEGCQTLTSTTVHTKCLCSRISTYAVLAQQAKDPDMGPSSMPSGLCTVTAAFLHFFFLASFCWVLTEAWQSYLAGLSLELLCSSAPVGVDLDVCRAGHY
ncbi:hypothetical protein CRUP_030803, partial [Coryphaenoides rupestris]